MKKNLLFALALLLSAISYAQTLNGFVGIGTTDPKAKGQSTTATGEGKTASENFSTTKTYQNYEFIN
jgi:hypothetical protein